MFSWLFSKTQDENTTDVVEWVIAQAQKTFPSYFEEETTHLRQRQLKFEAISTYLAMALYALKEKNDFAQAVHDEMFDRFEISLREQGVADVRVGKEVRKLASAFHGRYDYYASAFENNSVESLLETWQRNMVCENIDAKKASQQVIQTWQEIQNSPEKMAV